MRHRSMQRLSMWFVVSCFVACSSTPPPDDVVPELPSNIGINLAAINYYATQTPFADVFRSRDEWTTTDGITWDTELLDSIEVDADGYPLEVPSIGQRLRASVFQPFAAGSFMLTWSGDGEISVWGPGLERVSSHARSLKFSLTRSLDEPLFVQIERSSANDHVHDIRVVASSDFADAFESALSGFRVLRFMDWGATNGNPVARWSERPTELQAQGAARGAAIETMLDAANRMHADMWYSVPHMADDDFIERAAELIDERLAHDLKVYVEYSNENWNPIFPQVVWEQERGLSANLNADAAPDDDEASQRYGAGLKFSIRRAARAHATFKRVLGTRENDTINPLGGKPDALAIAPYFGRVYTPSDVGAANMSVAELLDDAEALIETGVGADTRANRKVADKHGVDLIAYEAGQHLLAIGGLENDAAFVQRLIAANRHARMGQLYRKAHASWLKNGGGLAVYFNSCQTPSKYGTWGALEYQSQPTSEAPKHAALMGLVNGSE
jgi:hypothetical protein